MKQLILLLMLFAGTLRAQSDTEFGLRDTLYSEILKEKRSFLVYIPKNENPYIQSETYPVLYLLDGDKLFLQTVGIVAHLSSPYGAKKCPKMIIVGIDQNDREADLLPKSAANTDLFTQFLQKELVPYIEKQYPAKPYRTLMGHSLGGLRAVNTVLYHPETFHAYLVLDPSLGHDLNVWSDKAHDMMQEKSFGNQSLYLAMAQTMPMGMDTAAIRADKGGMSRHMRAIMRFADDAAACSGLRFYWKYFPNETHGSSTFLGTYDGLKALFDWYDYAALESIYTEKVTEEQALKLLDIHYSKVSENMGFKVLPSESEVDQMIQLLLAKGMKSKAIAFAELNAKNYPKSSYAALFLNFLQWSDKKLLSELLEKMSAKEIYRLCQSEAKKTDPEYNISEMGINDFAYLLLKADRNTDALLFFELNVEIFPNAWNTYDGYGECLLKLGRKKEGLAAYKKSLELNPKNEKAADLLMRNR
jgi:hypothetical protein